jgi:hypothetical protein
MAAIEGRIWRSDRAVHADPTHVLDTLTDVEACKAWSPVGFDVDGTEAPRLRAGSTTNVSGRVAGHRVRFRVEVCDADAERLVLHAVGPVEMSVTYFVRRIARGSCVQAAISLRRSSGTVGALAAAAASGLLAAGALDLALARIAEQAEDRDPSAAVQLARAAA